MNRVLLGMLLWGLSGCASTQNMLKAGAVKACQDSCGNAKKSCYDRAASGTSGNRAGLGGAARDLAQKEAQTACDAAFNQCNHQCG